MGREWLHLLLRFRVEVFLKRAQFLMRFPSRVLQTQKDQLQDSLLEILRSELVTVPTFSAQVVAGRQTSA
jgi:hypothetical protein